MRKIKEIKKALTTAIAEARGKPKDVKAYPGEKTFAGLEKFLCEEFEKVWRVLETQNSNLPCASFGKCAECKKEAPLTFDYSHKEGEKLLKGQPITGRFICSDCYFNRGAG